MNHNDDVSELLHFKERIIENKPEKFKSSDTTEKNPAILSKIIQLENQSYVYEMEESGRTFLYRTHSTAKSSLYVRCRTCKCKRKVTLKPVWNLRYNLCF